MLHRIPGGVRRLGTAAALDAGTAPFNAVQLDSAGKLPAVDGSQLTGITAATAPDLEVLLAELSLGLADTTNVAQFLGSSGNRFADSFDALTYVDTVNSTNLDTSEAGALKPTVPINTISTSGLTKIGDAVNGGGLAAAFDGNTAQAIAAAAWKSSSQTSTYIGVNFSSAPTSVDSVTIYGTTDQGFSGNSVDSTVTITLYGSDTAPSSGTNGTNLGSWSGTDANSAVASITSTDKTTVWNYLWIYIVDSGTDDGGKGAAEVVFGKAGSPNNLTALSTALASSFVPSQARLVAKADEYAGALTLGTDLFFDVSRDGGTTWTTFSMSDLYTVGTVHVLSADSLSITGQPSGSSMKWRCRSQNNKNFKLDDLYLYWL